jgi:exodeoxyribonuclease III
MAGLREASLRLMTWNIWDGGGERVPLIAEVVAAVNPDVLLLNEADDEAVVADLADRLSYRHLWARGSGDKHIALLTRLPVVDWRVYNRRPLTQAILSATLSVQSTDQPSTSSEVQLFGVHLLPYFMLLPYEFARWRTVRALLRLTAREAKAPHLLFGDFNAAFAGERADTRVFSKSRQAQLWLQGSFLPPFALGQTLRAGYTDCFRHLHPDDPGLTWMPWALSARLDYIFADARMAQRLRACEVVTAAPAGRASDHFPLLAEFA